MSGSGPLRGWALIYWIYMPKRKIPLISGEYYHVFSRGSNKQPIFNDVRDYRRALNLIEFYMVSKPPLKYSKWLMLSEKRMESMKNDMKSMEALVECSTYCFMPNHWHFLLKQVLDDGVSRFMGNFQNSYTRYFNTRHNRIGPLFQGRFKSVRIQDERQLLQVSRYIHLNPHSSSVVKNINSLLEYPWSSLPEYLGNSDKTVCQKDLILSYFNGLESHKRFVLDRADYQRRLESIKHLILER